MTLATSASAGWSIPLVVDPVCASMHGDPLLRRSALDSLRGKLFPFATLVTPNLDEVRLLVGIDVVDEPSQQRAAAEALHALGPQWALVKGGHLRSIGQQSATCSTTAPTSSSSTRPRLTTGNDHGGGDTLAAAIACALAHGYSVPDAVAFGKRWVTECLRAVLPVGPRPRTGLGTVPAVMNRAATMQSAAMR